MSNTALQSFMELCFPVMEIVMRHALQCDDMGCLQQHCESMKYCLDHTSKCRLDSSSCFICHKMEGLMNYGPEELEMLRQSQRLAAFFRDEEGEDATYWLGFDELSLEDRGENRC